MEKQKQPNTQFQNQKQGSQSESQQQGSKQSSGQQTHKPEINRTSDQSAPKADHHPSKMDQSKQTRT